MELYDLTAYFFIYGVLGWCVEVAYAAVKTGKFVNRGFLNGPICPIYGVGVLSVIYCLSGVKGNLAVLYFASVVLVTAIEGLTGFVMDRLFHHKWWDYSDQPLNIGGYVCLIFSLIWGVFCVFIMKVFQPMVKGAVTHIPLVAGAAVLAVCSVGMIADLYVTASAILRLNRRLEAMERIAAELRELSDRMGENIYENVKDGMEKEERLAANIKETGRELREEYQTGARELYEEVQERKEEMQLRIAELRELYERKLGEKTAIGERLIKAFPGMESRRYKNAFCEWKNRMEERRK